ncbi:MAG TPA: CHASE2 domain-containing protein [Coleofasciculaceae cyanobacterium]
MWQWGQGRDRRSRWQTRQMADVLLVVAVAGSVLLVRHWGWLQQLELTAYDWLMRSRSAPTLHDRVVIIGVDEPDMRFLKAWPARDQDLAQLLERLVAARPAAIGLDIYRDLVLPPGTERLDRVLRQTDVPIIGIQLMPDAENKGIPPAPTLANSDRVGFNNIIVDPDRLVRRHILYWWHTDPKTQQRQAHQSFAFMLAQHYLQQRRIQLTTTDRPEQLQLGKLLLTPIDPNSGGYRGIDAGGYQILADWRGPAGTIPVVWWRDVVTGRVPTTQLSGRILVIGAMTESLKDYAYTPYSNQGQASAQPVFGAELQAQAIEQLLESAIEGRQPIRTWPEAIEQLWILIWTGIGAIAVKRARSIGQSALQLGLMIISVGGLTGLSLWWGWWIPSVPVALGMVGSAGGLLLVAFQRQQEQGRSTVFFQQVLAAIPEPLFVKDQNHRWIAVNPAFCNFIGFPAEALLGKTAEDVLPPELAAKLTNEDRRAIEQLGPCETQFAWPDALGQERMVETKRTLHRDRAGNRFLVGVLRDITEQCRAEAQLRRTAAELRDYTQQLELAHDVLQYQARHDGLTGLVNRKYFYERLELALQQAHQEQFMGAVLYLDLDGFKAVNDTLGHRAGDLLLIECAQRLTQNLRGSDTIARFGGDEFVALLPAIPQGEVAVRVAEKLLNAVSKPYGIEGCECHITVSIGVALFPQDSDTSDQLVEYADAAMFAAKGLGKNIVQLYANLATQPDRLVAQTQGPIG